MGVDPELDSGPGDKSEPAGRGRGWRAGRPGRTMITIRLAVGRC